MDGVCCIPSGLVCSNVIISVVSGIGKYKRRQNWRYSPICLYRRSLLWHQIPEAFHMRQAYLSIDCYSWLGVIRTGGGATKFSEKYLLQCHFTLLKSQMYWPGIEHTTLRWETSKPGTVRNWYLIYLSPAVYKFIVNLLKPTGHVMHQQFNLLKPTGYVMHQQFNLLKPTG